MNMPNTIAKNATSRRGSMRSSASIPTAEAGIVAIAADVLAIALGLLPIPSCYLTLVRRAAVLIA